MVVTVRMHFTTDLEKESNKSCAVIDFITLYPVLVVFLIFVNGRVSLYYFTLVYRKSSSIAWSWK